MGPMHHRGQTAGTVPTRIHGSQIRAELKTGQTRICGKETNMGADRVESDPLQRSPMPEERCSRHELSIKCNTRGGGLTQFHGAQPRSPLGLGKRASRNPQRVCHRLCISYK